MKEVNGMFEHGDVVEVLANKNDVFKHDFIGTVVEYKEEGIISVRDQDDYKEVGIISVRDQDDNVFDVGENQCELIKYADK